HEPDDGPREPEPPGPPDGGEDEADARERARDVERLGLLGRGEGLIGPQPLPPVVGGQRADLALAPAVAPAVAVAVSCLVHRVTSVLMPVSLVGILGAGRGNCGIRPVVRSDWSGSATSRPASSRPPPAALIAAAASCSAVAPPAETPSTVAVTGRSPSSERGLAGSTTVT